MCKGVRPFYAVVEVAGVRLLGGLASRIAGRGLGGLRGYIRH